MSCSGMLAPTVTALGCVAVVYGHYAASFIQAAGSFMLRVRSPMLHLCLAYVENVYDVYDYFVHIAANAIDLIALYSFMFILKVGDSSI